MKMINVSAEVKMKKKKIILCPHCGKKATRYFHPYDVEKPKFRYYCCGRDDCRELAVDRLMDRHDRGITVKNGDIFFSTDFDE
jgi:hypothetical protein